MIDPTKINADWHLCEQFSIDDTAALIAGYEPSSLCFNHDGDVWFTGGYGGFFANEAEFIPAIKATKKAIMHAIASGSLKGNIETYFNFNQEQINWGGTTINENDIRDWLRSRGRVNGFFFENYNSENHIQNYNQIETECSAPDLERQLAEMTERLSVVTNELEEARSHSPRHDTELLRLVRDVQERYWGDNWDKENPDSKSTKESIEDWLQSEHGLSKLKASAVESVACPIDRARSNQAY